MRNKHYLLAISGRYIFVDKDMLSQVVPASANLPPYIRPYVPSLIRCSDSKVPGCTLGIRRIFSLGSPELPPAVLAPPNILPLPRLDFGVDMLYFVSLPLLTRTKLETFPCGTNATFNCSVIKTLTNDDNQNNNNNNNINYNHTNSNNKNNTKLLSVEQVDIRPAATAITEFAQMCHPIANCVALVMTCAAVL
uniref:Uncharacterized protein n=1 Tax=Glossina pallidipes TaxID=7398 RepID=A0A1B0A9E0_GLOPL